MTGLAWLARSLLWILLMRHFCTLAIAALSLTATALPTRALGEDLFAGDAAFLGEIDTSRAPPPTRTRASELGVDGVLAFAKELSNKGLHSAALPFLRHVAEEAPGRADIWYQLASTLEAAHRKDEAAAAFDRYLSLSGSAPADPPRIVRLARAEPSPPPSRIALPVFEPAPHPAPARDSGVAPRPRRPPTKAAARAETKPARAKKTLPEGPPPSRGEINGMLEALGQL